MKKATDALKQQQEQRAEAQRAAAGEGAADASSHTKDAPGVAPAPSQDQHSGGQNSGAAEAKAPEAGQIPVDAAPAASQELAEMEAILQQARIATDDIFLLYDRPWLQGDPVPSGLADVPPGTIFVAPSPAASRGLTSKSMQVLRGPAFGVLEFFNDTCAVIVGLGPSQSQKRCSRLDALSGEGVSHA